jgi:hypothetical protein
VSKRCKSIAPVHDEMRCSKPRGHEVIELDTVHKNGMLVWGDDGKHRHLNHPLAGLRDGRVQIKFDTSPLNIDLTKFMAKPKGESPAAREGNRMSFGILDETHLKSAGDSLLAGIRNSFATMDEAETATATPEQQLTEWWMQQAEDEVARTVPKAVEYSATDLTDIGHDLARCMGREVDDEEAAELGVFFYLRGKMARWVGSVIAGDRVSDDTLFDIGVYVRMAQRIREFGSWPGTEETDNG